MSSGCGTRAGYKKHQRAGEQPCSACKRANKQYVAKSRRGAKPSAAGVSATAKPRAVQQDAPTAVEPAQDAPDFLEARGRALWDATLEAYELNPPARALLAEACRTIDRAERMAAMLASKHSLWIELGEPDEELGGIPIIVNGVIGEARQLQSQALSTLNRMGVVEVAGRATESAAVDPLDELARARAERMAARAAD